MKVKLPADVYPRPFFTSHPLPARPVTGVDRFTGVKDGSYITAKQLMTSGGLNKYFLPWIETSVFVWLSPCFMICIWDDIVAEVVIFKKLIPIYNAGMPSGFHGKMHYILFKRTVPPPPSPPQGAL